ncbi:aldo/keto reductase [Neorhizobium galegae]|uniref:aldo/keto reductase n=1 Tax=Neorhizobium galegae TaxID=399 RepID=UPI0006226CAB|nr:aldo/keto reductase [Neorhizobium galegae]CDZ26298.1 Aldo/keto reductase [Neorhizobium galegae bv. officinalis]KAA9385648.1 aldo/keto reductase [Neorhizobium galegae]KAB1112347.1 aldo/keto reductase [Neorhizobium galegae]MCM2499712.1 aldo/keto reductase [Neorhizobium galegae]MCQ1773070.1 aldo/keto reductase [Neorhizobium galegae]
MELRALGRTGLSISPVVLGCNVFGWTADERTSFDVLDRFFDAGFNTVDTADSYNRWVPGHVGGESEAIIGNWLKSGGISRDKAVIVTKVGSDMGQGKKDLSAKWILEEVENSLRRLQTDYIDLYLAHWPDDTVGHEETLGAFAKLKEQGKIRAIGCSNYDAKLLQESFEAAAKVGLPRYDVLQPQYNLYDRDTFEGPLADLCVSQEIGVINYYGLASGFLTGKYRDKADTEGKARGGRALGYLNDKGLRILAALDEVSVETNAEPASIALAWLIQTRGVTAPIASATSVGQLDAIIAAGNLTLSADQMKLLNEAGA